MKLQSENDEKTGEIEALKQPLPKQITELHKEIKNLKGLLIVSEETMTDSKQEKGRLWKEAKLSEVDLQRTKDIVDILITKPSINC